MLHTFEARIPVTPEQDQLLAAQAAQWSRAMRQAWVLLTRGGLSKTQAYPCIKAMGLTSHQAGCAIESAQMRLDALQELKKVEKRQLELSIEQRERAVRDKERKIASLEKRQAALRIKRDAYAPKPGRARTKRYLEVLRKLRELRDEMAFCHNWVRQKGRVLSEKRTKLSPPNADTAACHYRLCFGSKKLLRQRPTEHNAETTPFATLQAWQAQWRNARDGQWWSIGHTDKPRGNKEVQWLPETGQLRIRLTDDLAHARMDALGVPHGGTEQKFMPLRMQCRFALLDGVDFISHKGAAQAALLEAFGKRPVTMRVLSRLQADGTRAWYVQASLEVPSKFDVQTARTRGQGVMGVDFNAKGVAWCAVQPDRNPVASARGFLHWNLRGRTTKERRQEMGSAVAELARHAKRLKVAVAIEDLDFAVRRANARAGAVNKPYNAMLGQLASSQFAQFVARRCEKEQLHLYKVNPAYSSVGGFAKYGVLYRMTADVSAALWIGRQALYAQPKHTDGVQSEMKQHNESLRLPHFSGNPMQRMKALGGVQWRDVSRGLGRHRKHWGRKLHEWVTLQVAAASPAKAGPCKGLKRGVQPGTTRTPGAVAAATVC